MNIQELLSRLQSGNMNIDYRSHKPDDFTLTLQLQVVDMKTKVDAGEAHNQEYLLLSRDIPVRRPILSSPFTHLTAECGKCNHTLLPILWNEDTLTFVDRVLYYDSELFKHAIPVDELFIKGCFAVQSEGVIVHEKCYDCGCDTYTYSSNEFLSDELKLRCLDCKRLIEDERSRQMFIDNGMLPKSDYVYLVDRAIRLIKQAPGADEDLIELFKASEYKFRKLPECENTTMVAKGIIGFQQWCSDHDKTTSFLMDAMHDIVECNQNYMEEWFSPRTESFVNYKSKQ